MPIDAVVFVPGICGSVLKLGQEVIWPGTAWNVAVGNYSDAHVKLLATSDKLEPADVLRTVPLKVLGVTVHHFDGYQKALDALETMGFKEAAGTLIPFAYDWRRDVRQSAQALKERLAEGDLAGRSIALVAHSMGGLLTRYMLEKLRAPEDVHIELCVLVAVPHLGAPVVLQNILGLRPELFLSSRQCKEVLRDPKFPSAYQLLPRLGVPTLLQAAIGKGFEITDPYESAIGQHLGLLGAGVDAARVFGGELAHLAPGFNPPCRYVAIAGNAQKTTTANYIEGHLVRAVEERTAGDGTVPLWSAAPPGVPIRYVPAAHGGMFGDSDVIAMLQAVLRPELPGGRTFSLEPSATPSVFTVQTLHESVEVDEEFTVAVVADRATGNFDAVLEIEKLFENRRESAEVSLRYNGGPIRSLSVDLNAPSEPAVLKLRVRPVPPHLPGAEGSVLVLAK